MALFSIHSTPAGRRHQQLQNQVEHLQEELYRTEAGKTKDIFIEHV